MLEQMLDHKRAEVAERRREVPLTEVRRLAETAPPARDFLARLRGERVALLAEVKRASPSRGSLAPALEPAALAQLYERAGAAAISVLTDRRFFAGSLADLTQARGATTLPVLRKDFVLDEYQVYEARAAGADALLLIVAALPDERVRDLLALSRQLGLRCLVETHSAGEVERALACGAEIVGINNRDLRTFAVDLATGERLAPLVPANCAVVCESGIHAPADVERLAAAGADAVLVGEALVTAADTAAAARALVAVPRRGRPPAEAGGNRCM